MTSAARRSRRTKTQILDIQNLTHEDLRGLGCEEFEEDLRAGRIDLTREGIQVPFHGMERIQPVAVGNMKEPAMTESSDSIPPPMSSR